MLIMVRVFVNAKNNNIIKKTEDSFDVFVKAKPINGMANKAVIENLSDYFEISQKKIKIVRGFKNYNKIINIT